MEISLRGGVSVAIGHRIPEELGYPGLVAKKKYVVAAPKGTSPRLSGSSAENRRVGSEGSPSSVTGRGARAVDASKARKKKYVVAPPGAKRSAGVKRTVPEAPESFSKHPQRSYGHASQGDRSVKGTWLRRAVALSCAILVATLAYGAALLWRFDASVERFEKGAFRRSAPLALGTFNVLVVGSDSREGDNAAVASGETPGLADTIIVARIGLRSVKLLSIPRDTRVVLGNYGEQKLNAALPLGGPNLLAQAVSSITGLPIHHVVALDFKGFVALTDAVGGVELCLDHAERDAWSGLSLPQGCQIVGGEQALAYVRSRHTEQLRDGKWVADTGGDFSRIERQQRYFGALTKRLQDPRVSLLKGWSTVAALGRAIEADGGFRYYQELRLAVAMGFGKTERYTLPGRPVERHGVSYVEIDKAAAEEVLRRFA